CNHAGKPVITATQMLDSMQHNPRCTRAEASDVANAIFDGRDAVMLSGETASGEYPAEAVMTMADIEQSSETAQNYKSLLTERTKYQDPTVTSAICVAAAHNDIIV